MDNIRVGIIGVGQIGKVHLNNYQKIPGIEVVAIADIDIAEADRVKELYKIPTVYYKAQDMLKRDDIQAVDVCLHNNLHRSGTLAALEAGKHVYCEKPMAGSYIDALAMVEAAKSAGLMLSIQLNTLFSKETKAGKALIDSGLLGHIYHARSVGFRRRGRPYVDGYGTARFVQKEIASGGALYDVGVYHIAAILYLLGNPKVERVSGKIYQETDMDAERQGQSGYDVEELGLGFARLEEGLTLDIIESWAIHQESLGSSLVAGSKGIRLEPFGFFQSVGDLDFNGTANLEGFDWRLHSLRSNPDAYDSAQQHWVGALQGRVPLLPTADLALNTMLISEGIYLSDRLKREVSAEEILNASVSKVKPL
jgi:predicted dehydrogenase